jgi:hypothetical protein
LGSAFTNGFARLLPGPYHVPFSFFLPQLFKLAVLLYWLVRVRYPGWQRQTNADSSSRQREKAIIAVGSR